MIPIENPIFIPNVAFLSRIETEILRELEFSLFMSTRRQPRAIVIVEITRFDSICVLKGLA